MLRNVTKPPAIGLRGVELSSDKIVANGRSRLPATAFTLMTHGLQTCLSHQPGDVLAAHWHAHPEQHPKTRG